MTKELMIDDLMQMTVDLRMLCNECGHKADAE